MGVRYEREDDGREVREGRIGGGSVVAGLRHGTHCRVRWIERWDGFV